MSSLLWLILFVIVIVVSNLITRKAPLSKEDKKFYTYAKKSRIMTDHEHEFYLILNEALSQNYYILAQAHLSSFLDEKIKGQNWKGAFRHINGKSVDYLICDKHTLQPLLAIELDDKTHVQDDRKVRDAEVERILAETNLPLLRMKSHGHINILELQELVAQKISQNK